MEITVKNSTKFGLITVDGKMLSNYDKSYDHTKAKAGDVLEVEIKTSKAGKDYINKIKERKHLVQTASVVPQPAKTVATQTATVVKPRDFDKEAQGKTRCALYEAALGSPILAQMLVGSTKEEAKALIKEFVEDGFDVVFGK
jgi:hypothetical protein